MCSLGPCDDATLHARIEAIRHGVEDNICQSGTCDVLRGWQCAL
jgi:hypothetical protein